MSKRGRIVLSFICALMAAAVFTGCLTFAAPVVSGSEVIGSTTLSDGADALALAGTREITYSMEDGWTKNSKTLKVTVNGGEQFVSSDSTQLTIAKKDGETATVGVSETGPFTYLPPGSTGGSETGENGAVIKAQYAFTFDHTSEFYGGTLNSINAVTYMGETQAPLELSSLSVKLDKVDTLGVSPIKVEIKNLGKRSSDGWYGNNDAAVHVMFAPSAESDINSRDTIRMNAAGVKADGTSTEINKSDLTHNTDVPVTFEDATWTIRIWAEDEAGNKSNVFEEIYRIDGKAPSLSVTTQLPGMPENGDPSEIDWSKEDITVRLDNTTTGNNVSGVKYGYLVIDLIKNPNGDINLAEPVYLNNKPSQDASATFNVTESEYKKYIFFIESGAGKRTTFKDGVDDKIFVVKLDKDLPELKVTPKPLLGDWTGNDVTFTIKLANNTIVPSSYESGVNYYYSIDGAEWILIDGVAANGRQASLVITVDSGQSLQGDFRFKAETVTENIYEAEDVYSVKIDKTTPDLLLTAENRGGEYQQNTWTYGDVAFTFNIGNIDGIASGVKEVRYTTASGKLAILPIDGNKDGIISKEELLDYKFVVTADGSALSETYRFTVTTVSGNTRVAEDFTVLLDDAEPIFDMVSANSAISGRWHNEQETVLNINYGDLNLSGVEFYYTVKNINEQVVHEGILSSDERTVSFDDEGKYTVEVTATSGAGKSFTHEVFYSWVDKTVDYLVPISGDPWGDFRNEFFENGIWYIHAPDMLSMMSQIRNLQPYADAMSEVTYQIVTYDDSGNKIEDDSIEWLTNSWDPASKRFEIIAFGSEGVSGSFKIVAIDAAGNSTENYVTGTGMDDLYRFKCDTDTYEVRVSQNLADAGEITARVNSPDGMARPITGGVVKAGMSETIYLVSTAGSGYLFGEYSSITSGNGDLSLIRSAENPNIIGIEIDMFGYDSAVKYYEVNANFYRNVDIHVNNNAQKYDGNDFEYSPITGVLTISDGTTMDFTTSAESLTNTVDIGGSEVEMSLLFSVVEGELSASGLPVASGIYNLTITINDNVAGYRGTLSTQVFITAKSFATFSLNLIPEYNGENIKQTILDALTAVGYKGTPGGFEIVEGVQGIIMPLAAIKFYKGTVEVESVIDAGEYYIDIAHTSGDEGDDIYSVKQKIQFIVKPKTVDISANGDIITKQYDGGDDYLSQNILDHLNISEMLGEEMQLTYDTFKFGGSNAGDYLTVLSGLRVGNNNYVWVNEGLTLEYDGKITPREVTAGAGSEVYTRDYNGSDVVTDGNLAEIGRYIAINGLVGDEVLYLVYDKALLNGADAGNDKILTLSGLAVSGGNYLISNVETDGSYTVAAAVDKLLLTDMIFTDVDKVFDGKPVTRFNMSVDGLLESELADDDNDGIPDVLRQAIDVRSDNGRPAAALNAGIYRIIFTKDKLANYYTTGDVEQTFEIESGNLILRPASGNSKTWDNKTANEIIDYAKPGDNGNIFVFTVKAEEREYTFPENYSLRINFSLSGNASNVSNSHKINVQYAILYNGAENEVTSANYSVNCASEVTFSIVKLPVVIVPNVKSYQYAGTEFKQIKLTADEFAIFDTDGEPLAEDLLRLIRNVSGNADIIAENGALAQNVGNYLWSNFRFAADSGNGYIGNFAPAVSGNVEIIPRPISIHVASYDIGKTYEYSENFSAASLNITFFSNGKLYTSTELSQNIKVVLNNVATEREVGEAGLHHAVLSVNDVNDNYDLINVKNNIVMNEETGVAYGFDITPKKLRFDIVVSQFAADFGMEFESLSTELSLSTSLYNFYDEKNNTYAIPDGVSVQGTLTISAASGTAISAGYLNAGGYVVTPSGVTLGYNYELTEDTTPVPFEISRKKLDIDTDINNAVYDGAPQDGVGYVFKSGEREYVFPDGIVNPFNVTVIIGSGEFYAGTHEVEFNVTNSNEAMAANYEIIYPKNKTFIIDKKDIELTVQRVDGNSDWHDTYSALFNVYGDDVFAGAAMGLIGGDTIEGIISITVIENYINTVVYSIGYILNDENINYRVAKSTYQEFTLTKAEASVVIEGEWIYGGTGLKLIDGHKTKEAWTGLIEDTDAEKAKILPLTDGRLPVRTDEEKLNSSTVVGEYTDAIVVDGDYNANEYYSLEVSSVVTVVPAEITVDVGVMEVEYGTVFDRELLELALPLTLKWPWGEVIIDISQFTVVCELSAADWRESSPAGDEYSVSVTSFSITAPDSNYVISGTSVTDILVHVTRRTLNVTVESGTKIFDNSAATDPAVNYALSKGSAPLYGDDNLADVLSVTRDAGQNAGNYSYVIDVKNENYAVVFDNQEQAKFTITPRVAALAISVTEKVYHGAVFGDISQSLFRYTVSGEGMETLDSHLMSGFAYTVDGMTVDTSYKFVRGNSVISVSLGENAVNYDVTVTPFELEVLAKTVTVTFNGGVPQDVTQFSYDGTSKKPVVVYAGDGGELAGTATVKYYNASGEEIIDIINAGDYTVKLNTGNDNYILNKTEYKIIVVRGQLNEAGEYNFPSEQSYEYDMNGRAISLKVPSDHPTLSVVYTYTYNEDVITENSVKAVGSYEVTATVTHKENAENYEQIIKSYSFDIVKRVLNTDTIFVSNGSETQQYNAEGGVGLKQDWLSELMRAASAEESRIEYELTYYYGNETVADITNANAGRDYVISIVIDDARYEGEGTKVLKITRADLDAAAFKFIQSGALLYNGQVHTLEYGITEGREDYVNGLKGIDWEKEIVYTDNNLTDAGSIDASVRIGGVNYNAITLIATLKVSRLYIKLASDLPETVYNGNAHDITVKLLGTGKLDENGVQIFDSNGKLPDGETIADIGYDLIYTLDGNNVKSVIDAGEYKVKIVVDAKNYYYNVGAEDERYDFKVLPKNVTATIGGDANLTYNTKEHKLTASFGDDDVEYSLSYSYRTAADGEWSASDKSVINAGYYKVTVTILSANHTFGWKDAVETPTPVNNESAPQIAVKTFDYEFTVAKATLADGDVRVPSLKLVYNGSSRKLKDSEIIILREGAALETIEYFIGDKLSGVTNVGLYKVKATVGGVNYESKVYEGSINIEKAVLTFKILETTETTIVVELIRGALYSLDGEEWQDSNEFTDLDAGKEYTVFVQMTSNYAGNYVAAEASNTAKTTGEGGITVLGYVMLCGGALIAVIGLVVGIVLMRRRK